MMATVFGVFVALYRTVFSPQTEVSAMQKWMESRLRAAKRDIKSHGVPGWALRSTIKVAPNAMDCRVCVEDSVIYYAKWWARLCYETSNEEQVERWLRHELGHVLASYEVVHDGFELPDSEDYPGAWEFWGKKLEAFVSGAGYGSTHPEEDFAERVSDLHKATLKKVAKLLAA